MYLNSFNGLGTNVRLPSECKRQASTFNSSIFVSRKYFSAQICIIIIIHGIGPIFCTVRIFLSYLYWTGSSQRTIYLTILNSTTLEMPPTQLVPPSRSPLSKYWWCQGDSKEMGKENHLLRQRNVYKSNFRQYIEIYLILSMSCGGLLIAPPQGPIHSIQWHNKLVHWAKARLQLVHLDTIITFDVRFKHETAYYHHIFRKVSFIL